MHNHPQTNTHTHTLGHRAANTPWKHTTGKRKPLTIFPNQKSTGIHLHTHQCQDASTVRSGIHSFAPCCCSCVCARVCVCVLSKVALASDKINNSMIMQWKKTKHGCFKYLERKQGQSDILRNLFFCRYQSSFPLEGDGAPYLTVCICVCLLGGCLLSWRWYGCMSVGCSLPNGMHGECACVCLCVCLCVCVCFFI